jgi:hypothetical protein
MIADKVPCGPDLDHHVEKLTEYVTAGFDELFVSQIGPHSEEFFRAYEKEVLPALRERA